VFGLKLRNDPMNLLGIMPAKEGRKKSKKVKGKRQKNLEFHFLLLTFYLLLVKHSFAGCFLF